MSVMHFRWALQTGLVIRNVRLTSGNGLKVVVFVTMVQLHVSFWNYSPILVFCYKAANIHVSFLDMGWHPVSITYKSNGKQKFPSTITTRSSEVYGKARDTGKATRPKLSSGYRKHWRQNGERQLLIIRTQIPVGLFDISSPSSWSPAGHGAASKVSRCEGLNCLYVSKTEQ